MFGPEIYFLYVDLHYGISIAKYHPLQAFYNIFSGFNRLVEAQYQPLIRAEEFFTWLICILFAAERILFAVTVYKDAKMRCKKYVVLWSVLVGVLGPLCGVVYWIVRKTVYAEKIVCADCGHVQHVVQHGDNQRTVSVLFIVSCIVLATVLLLHNFFYGTFCMLSDGSNIPAWIWSFP